MEKAQIRYKSYVMVYIILCRSENVNIRGGGRECNEQLNQNNNFCFEKPWTL